MSDDCDCPVINGHHDSFCSVWRGCTVCNPSHKVSSPGLTAPDFIGAHILTHRRELTEEGMRVLRAAEIYLWLQDNSEEPL